MKTKLLLAGASALALSWAQSARAENVGIGVLEPQAVLHVSGDTGSADDIILENLDPFTGSDILGNVLLVDGSDGQRVKTVPLFTLESDLNFKNTDFDFDPVTNILSITEANEVLTVDLSSLSDALNDTDTNTTIASVSYLNGTVTITDSEGNSFPVDISSVDTTISNTAATFDGGTNILTISDETGDVTVDLSGLSDTDSDTTIVSFDYAPDTNNLSIVDSELNQFAVDLTELQDTFSAVNLANSDLVQTAGDAVRVYDGNGQTLNFRNGPLVVGDYNRTSDEQSSIQRLGNQDGNGYIEAPAVYTQLVEAVSETGAVSTGIALGMDGHFNTDDTTITMFTLGTKRLTLDTAGTLTLYPYGENRGYLRGNAALDRYLTVDSDGVVGEVSAPVDTTVKNTAATLDAQNVLTITDQQGDVSVDLSALAVTLSDSTVSNTAATFDGGTNILTITDETGDITVDLSGLDGASVDTNYDVDDTLTLSRELTMAGNTLNFEDGIVAVGQNSALRFGTLMQNSDAILMRRTDNGFNDSELTLVLGDDSLAGSDRFIIATEDDNNIATERFIFDTNGQVTMPRYGTGDALVVGDAVNDLYLTVDAAGNVREVSAQADTTISNTGATLDAQNVLTITDETGDVTVDLSDLAVTLSDTTVSNTAAALDGSTNVLTITDETGDVTVDLSALSDTLVDTTIANISATFRGSDDVLTITDEAGSVTVDLSAVNSDTTDNDWAAAGTTNSLATRVSDDIYTNGNVGINTNTPAYPLVIDTAATQNALVVREATDNGQTLGRVGVGTDTPGYALDVTGDIRATGNIYSGDQFLASNFFQTSDRRLKTGVEGFNRGLEILRQLRLVSYRYNGMGLPTNTDRVHYGVIAQELQAIDPELVGSFFSPEDGTEYLTVNVQSMIYVLANALQQIDADNARMAAMVMESEIRIAALEDRMRLMEARLGVSDQ